MTTLFDEAYDWLLDIQEIPQDPLRDAWFVAWLRRSPAHRREFCAVYALERHIQECLKWAEISPIHGIDGQGRRREAVKHPASGASRYRMRGTS